MSRCDLFNPPSPAGQFWRDWITVHPAADLFPMMSDEGLIALGKDIKKNEVWSSITFQSTREVASDTDTVLKAPGRPA
jgi:hypothetical protein